MIDGNKEYNPAVVAICILKWVNAIKNIDIKYNEIYNCLFTSFDNQFNLIEIKFIKIGLEQIMENHMVIGNSQVP